MPDKNDENSESLREIVGKSQERIRSLLKKIKEIEEKHTELDTSLKIIQNKNIDKLQEDIHILDKRIQAVEIAQGGHNENRRQIINFVLQLIWVVMSAYILLKLGLPTP